MKIQFKNVLPLPIEKSNLSDNTIWNTEFTFSSNDRIVLEAVSGKGKSTFVNLINGSRNDYEGSIFIDGNDVKSFSHQKWSEMRTHFISTVFQDLKLLEELSVYENISIKNQLTNYFTEQQINQLINRVGLSDKKDKKVKFLSYGQKQRVAILRALAQPFKILLLDEPFSHLDVKNQKLLITILNESMNRNNAGFVLTSLNNLHSFEHDTILSL